MAIIFAVVGGGAVVGIATTDPYSDHSDYSNYSNYSNYSDAAERRARRRKEKEKEIGEQRFDINTYKINSVNDYLKSEYLKQQSGISVNLSAVEQDGNDKISNEENDYLKRESADIKKEISDIEELLKKIDTILEEENK